MKLRTFTKTILPNTSLHSTASNSRIDFTVNVPHDTPLMLDIKYDIFIETPPPPPAAGGGGGGDREKLPNNPVPAAFNRIEVRFNNTLVDHVDDPEKVSNMLCKIVTNKYNENERALAGYSTTTTTTTATTSSSRGRFVGGMHHLGLGIFPPLHSGECGTIAGGNDVKLTFYRSQNQSLNITNFVLVCRFIDTRNAAPTAMAGGDAVIPFYRYRLATHENAVLRAASRITIDLTNETDDGLKPDHVLCETTPAATLESLQLVVGGSDRYPQEPQEAYEGDESIYGYVAFNEGLPLLGGIGGGGPEPVMTVQQWKLSPIYSVSLQSYDENNNDGGGVSNLFASLSNASVALKRIDFLLITRRRVTVVNNNSFRVI